MSENTEYKATLHVPVEQYGFIAVEVQGTPEELVEAYRGISRANMSGDGLPDDKFDQFVQNQLSGLTNTLEDYNKMSPEQQKYVQINKRAIKRINYKLTKEEK